MKNLVFHRSRDEDYTAPGLLRLYVAEHKNEGARLCYGRGGLWYKISGVYYRFDSWKIEKQAKKTDIITITLTEIED